MASLRFPAVVGIALSVACASRGPSPHVAAELGGAEALLREGCYACLREAQAVFDREAAGPRPPAAALQGAFDAALLIGLREKELGMPWDASMARARAVAARMPAIGSPPTAALLKAADLFIGETSGLGPDQRAHFTGRERPVLLPDDPVRRALDSTIATSIVAAYLSLAIDCEQPRLRDTARPDETLAMHRAPLIQFRAGICGQGSAAIGSQVAPLRASNPRWVDTLPFEARAAMVGSRERGIDLYKAAELLSAAHEAFPTSVAITMTWAQNNLSLAEFDRALEGFGEVLAMAPTHRDAMLGRLTSLSYALRHEDAVATATRMIELGTWHQGDAYYWRAWNRYNLKTYDPAWTDVEMATTLLSNTSVYTLAGLIAYSRRALPTALERFDRAFQIDSTNCDAVWMAGLIHVEQQAWSPATPKFSKAMACYAQAASIARSDLAALEASPRPEAQKARPRERLRQTINVSDERAGQSAFNAAQGFARTGQKTSALAHVDVAASYAPLKEKAAALRAAIEKMPDQ